MNITKSLVFCGIILSGYPQPLLNYDVSISHQQGYLPDHPHDGEFQADDYSSEKRNLEIAGQLSILLDKILPLYQTVGTKNYDEKLKVEKRGGKIFNKRTR